MQSRKLSIHPVIRVVCTGLWLCGFATASLSAQTPERGSETQSADGLRNIGEPINTPLDEFSPTVTADGRTMVFNSKKIGERYQSLYITERDAQGRWSPPRPLRGLNSIYNDEAPFITPDGKLLLFASDRDGSKEMPADASGRVRVSFDIYWARRNSQTGEWSRPLPVPGGVNTPDHERSPGLDLRTGRLFFARWPFGSFEGARIYEAEYQAGRFRNARALPEAINSGHQEAAFVPALDRANGYYFSSRRPGGPGGWDIYYVSFDGQSYGQPELLGADVNSEANDIYYSVRESVGFLSSDREGGVGRYDIYGIPAQAPPQEIVVGVRDAKTGKAMIKTWAKVERDPAAEREYQTNPQGRFKLQVESATNKGDRARLRVNQPGYLPFEEQLDLAEVGRRKPSEGEPHHWIDLQPVEKDASFDVHAIHFDANEAVIKAESHGVLNELAEYLKANPGLRLEIIGHTDLHGTHDYNIDLSLQRAKAVRDYLVKAGLAGERFAVKGAGFTKPVIKKKGDGFDEKNRRTEFRIMGVN